MQVVDLLLSGVLPRFPSSSCRSRAASASCRSSSRRPTTASSTRRCGASGPSSRCGRATTSAARSTAATSSRRTRRSTIDIIGADNVLFETDYPHPVCLFGNVRERIDAGFGGQAAGRRKLLWENAAKLYGVAAPDRPVLTGSRRRPCASIRLPAYASDRRRNCRKSGAPLLEEGADRLHVLRRAGLRGHSLVLGASAPPIPA